MPKCINEIVERKSSIRFAVSKNNQFMAVLLENGLLQNFLVDESSAEGLGLLSQRKGEYTCTRIAF